MKMKMKLMLTLTVFAFKFVTAQNVNFSKSKWDKILAESKKTNKPIFLDLYTTWCGPCKMLDKQVYRDNKVGKFMNENFINVKIDAEKGEGLTLSDLYAIDSYPTLIFLNPAGTEIYRYSGFKESNGFIEEAKYALNSVNEPSIADFDKKYLDGNREESFLLEYLKKINKSSPESINEGEKLDDYLTSKSSKGSLSDEDLNLIWTNMASVKPNSLAYQLTKKNAQRLIKITEQVSDSDQELIKKLDTFISYYSLQRAVTSNNQNDFKAAISDFRTKSKVDKSWFRNTNKLVFDLENYYYLTKNDLTSYFEVCKKYITSEYPIGSNLDQLFEIHKDVCMSKIEAPMIADKPSSIEIQNAKMACAQDFALDLNNIAWAFYEKKSPDLVTPLEWSKMSLDLSPESAYLDTYAHLLYVNNNKVEAIKYQTLAVKKAKENSENSEELELALEKMISGKLD